MMLMSWSAKLYTILIANCHILIILLMTVLDLAHILVTRAHTYRVLHANLISPFQHRELVSENLAKLVSCGRVGVAFFLITVRM